MNEAETRAELIDPALKDAGWVANSNRPPSETFDRLPGFRQTVTRY
jgi:type I site-specific restriction endonuclease